MDSKYTMRLCLAYVLSFVALTILFLCLSKSPTSPREEVNACIIKCTGTIAYAYTQPIPATPPSNQISLIDWIVVVSGIVTIVLGIWNFARKIADLVKSLLWTAKHGKFRTPIICRTDLRAQL